MSEAEIVFLPVPTKSLQLNTIYQQEPPPSFLADSSNSLSETRTLSISPESPSESQLIAPHSHLEPSPESESLSELLSEQSNESRPLPLQQI